MSLVKHVCGACGAPVQRTDAVCLSCHEPLEWEPATGPVKCSVCGTQNPPGTALCGSCGARLGAGDRQGTSRPLRERRSKPAAGQGGPPTKRLEPWQIASGAAVLLLIAVFVYLELSREHPPSQVASGISSAQGVAPMTSPMANLAPLEQAVRENPRDPEALLALANARHDVGQFPLAIETYQRYLQEKPGDPNARVDLGICYFELGRLDSVNAETLFMQAMEEMQRVHRKHPRHQQATFNLGIVNLVRRDLKEASRWFQKTVEIDKASELGQRAQQMLQQHAAIP